MPSGWNRGRGGEEHRGHELLEKYGCLGCHSQDGTPKVGPSFKGIWGRSETVVTNGVERTITVDEAYLRRSYSRSESRLWSRDSRRSCRHFRLKEDELSALLEYLKGLK